MASRSSCPQCGFDYATTDPGAARRFVLDGAADIRALIERADATVRTSPAPNVWSALEYGCHVRDVLLAQRERCLQTLVEDNPSFVPIYRDQRAALCRYSEEGERDVGAQLVTAARLFVWVFDGLNDEQLARPCINNYPQPAQRDIGWLLVHTAHEVVHHGDDVRALLHDVGR